MSWILVFIFSVPRSWLLIFFFVAGALHAVEQDGSLIAREALRVSPLGDWDFLAELTTSVSGSVGPKSIPGMVQIGERFLLIQFRHLEEGMHKIVYKGRNPATEGWSSISKDEQDLLEGVQIFLPERGNIKILDLLAQKPVADLQASFMKSMFSMEDLSLRFLSWSKQELEGEDTLKDRPCWKIVSRPSQKDQSLYHYVESWIDKEYQVLFKALAYDAEDQIVKEVNVRSVQKFDKVWMLKTLEINAPKWKCRSRLQIIEGKRLGEEIKN